MRSDPTNALTPLSPCITLAVTYQSRCNTSVDLRPGYSLPAQSQKARQTDPSKSLFAEGIFLGPKGGSGREVLNLGAGGQVPEASPPWTLACFARRRKCVLSWGQIMEGVTASSRWQSLADRHRARVETNGPPAWCRMKSNGNGKRKEGRSQIGRDASLHNSPNQNLWLLDTGSPKGLSLVWPIHWDAHSSGSPSP